MSRFQIITLSIAALALAGVAGCSDKSSHMDEAAAALSEYFATHPFERDWSVETIAIMDADNKLVAKVLVNSDTDVGRLRLLSRMEQFTIAKLACPTMTPELRDALGDTRIWVQLVADGKELTSSICPR